MFHSKKQITQRHGRAKPDRPQYLQQLVQEYTTTDDLEARQQVLANLANFAYDPVNYDWLWQVNVVDLFLDALDQDDQQLQEFGMGGLANICSDPKHHYYIVSDPNHLEKITRFLHPGISNSDNTLLNTMMTLMLLVDPEHLSVILTADLKNHLIRLRTDARPSISRLADLFLKDHYSNLT